LHDLSGLCIRDCGQVENGFRKKVNTLSDTEIYGCGVWQKTETIQAFALQHFSVIIMSALMLDSDMCFA